MKNLALLFLLSAPMLFTQTEERQRTETRQNIIVEENGVRKSLEIIEKDGKITLNGKPLSEATQEELSMYEGLRSQNAQNVQRVRVRPLEGGNNEIMIERCEGEDCPPMPPNPPHMRERRIEIRCEGNDECNMDERAMRMECDDEAADCPMRELGNNRVMIWKQHNGDSMRVNVENFGNRRNHYMEREPRVFMFQQNDDMPNPMEMMGSVFEGMHLGRNGFRFERPNPEIMQMEMEIRRLAQQIKGASGTEKESLKRDLKNKLADLFAKKEAQRQEKIERLENELREEREMSNTRNRNKNQIIERRMNELLEEKDVLDW